MTGPKAPRETRPAWLEALAAASRPGRRAARALLHRIDGLLHPVRHRRAVRELRSRLPVERIVILCFGNICRSPYAEHRLKERLADTGDRADLQVRVTSAGFYGPDRGSPEAAVEAARERGIDLQTHRSQLFTPDMAKGQDLIVVMTEKQRRNARKVSPGAFILRLGDLDPEIPTQRDIPDPYGHPREFFLVVYARIDRTLDVFVNLMDPSNRVRSLS